MDASFLTPTQFSEACKALPLVSIDLAITTPDKQLLLGKRINAPARDTWFTPGGRIRKNEPLTNAKQRIAYDELGLHASVLERATLMGTWDHFFQDSAFSPETSTHYVNLPHWLEISEHEKLNIQLPKGPGFQHSHWHWFDLDAIEKEATIHPYARIYAKWITSELLRRLKAKEESKE
jgi:colanic acid biosynthesis protein WcaH